MNSSEFIDLLERIYGPTKWPKPLHVLQGVQLVESGVDLSDAASRVGTLPRYLEPVLKASDPVEEALGLSPRDINQESRDKALQALGQMLLGRAAEIAFEDIYREEMSTNELELRDLRESRTDTDYRLYNGQGRPIYRINIKFHGALFRRASELVNLDPEDCFALATYKIHQAVVKHDREHLPYLFAVVGDRTLSGESAGATIPGHFVAATALIHQAPKGRGKRDFEDAVVECLVREQNRSFQSVYESLHDADWYVLSAKRADKLLKEQLYERVFALRVPRFAQQFRFAELDMHFSLSEDLTPLRDFLKILREDGHPRVATQVAQGVI